LSLPAEFSSLASDQSRIASLEEGKPIRLHEVRTIAGCSQASMGGRIGSVVALFTYPALSLSQAACSLVDCDMEYRPGFLAYREGPALVKCLDMLASPPDVLMVPASGIDHPRRLGMARHIGALLDVPTVGVTRRPLLSQKSPGRQPSSPVCIKTGREGGVIYVSRGWRVEARAAVELVRSCIRGHTMPEPLRIAKCLMRAWRREVWSDRIAGDAMPTDPAPSGRDTRRRREDP